MRPSRHYFLGLLTVILAFNYTDRWAFGLVAQDIKTDLKLSDTDLGLLSGIAFALFYSLMGLPIARQADRGNRVTIIWISTFLWSIAVAVSGWARSFYQLMSLRVIVGVGEAGCVPPAHSLIADLYSRTERPRAVSIYMQGIAASTVLGYFVAGWLNQIYGWRFMFALVGLPGLGLAVLAGISLTDPRSYKSLAPAPSTESPRLGAAARALLSSITFRHLLVANSVLWFISYGTQQWTPVFFVRSFALRTGELGTWLAVLYGLGGFLGTYLGGEWASRTSMRDERKQLRGMAGLIAVSAVFIAFTYIHVLAPNALLAFVWLGLGNLVAVMTNGPLFAVIQTLVPPRLRAVSVALIFLCGNLVGLGLGPWAAGALSDALRPLAGAHSLRYAMLILCPGFLWGAWHLWAAGDHIRRELPRGSFERSYAENSA